MRLVRSKLLTHTHICRQIFIACTDLAAKGTAARAAGAIAVRAAHRQPHGQLIDFLSIAFFQVIGKCIINQDANLLTLCSDSTHPLP